MATDISLGLGEYLTVWVIVGIIAVGLLGLLFGVAGGGVAVFIIAGVLTALIIYAVLSRAYRALLHGNIRGGGDSGGGDAL
jgi:hypothetical protein